ncbi:MAG: ATP synthase F0 subunit C [bacterium]|nr:ATP synthase F0 subunit C [bacterium]
MIQLAEFLHYSTIALAVGINAIGVGIGQGLTSSAALTAMNQQPNARTDINKVAILGMALIETSAIMGAFVALILLLGGESGGISNYVGLAELGIAFAICLPGLVLGIVSSFPAQAACTAIARQPFFSQKILRFMLITQSLIQTPIIFGLIIALFIKGQSIHAQTLRESLRLIGSGLCIGLGSIGPAIGLAKFAQEACYSIGINPKEYNKILSFTFISEAIIETPIIFSLVISMSLLFLVAQGVSENVLDGIVLFSAGLCTGMGTLGPGMSSGRIASSACHQIALNPAMYSVISRLSMVGQGLIETCAIYAILISFLLLFFR